MYDPKYKMNFYRGRKKKKVYSALSEETGRQPLRWFVETLALLQVYTFFCIITYKIQLVNEKPSKMAITSICTTRTFSFC